MSWRVVHLKSRNVIKTEYSGTLSIPEIKKAIEKSFGLGKKNNIMHYLWDCTGMNNNQPYSVLDTYKLGEFFEIIDIDKSIKEAIVMPDSPELIDCLRFFETTTLNRGYNIKVFMNEEEAMEWLTR